MTTAEHKARLDFVRQKIADDLAAGRYEQIVTRFPPEPNGFLHIGHAKAICIDFGIAEEINAGAFGDEYRGRARCHLRFDDTNPTKEERRFIDAIEQDIRWLGFEWGSHEYFASDYFQQLYDWACDLVRRGLAYVDDQSAEQIRLNRGTLTEPGVESEHRSRSPEENLDLFQRMKDGEFPDGSRVLRAKIDMASPNINLRDPVMYRILRAPHPRTGDAWCIYPTYDWAHGQSDSIEGVTHSLCSLEFEDHRPLYEWFIEQLGIFPSRQTEFARLNLTHTIVTKRKLRQLVEENHVRGWDDPRMPTLRGMRRRGYPPAAIRRFCDEVGVSKRNQRIDLSRLEHCVRDELNRSARRLMGVLDPLRVIIENYPEGRVEHLDAINNPEDPLAGSRPVPFSRELFIEREDFMEDPPRKFFRLAPGREVRLRYAYFITCTDVVKEPETGAVTELRCTYDPQTRGGDAPDGRKVKATLHWVSASHAQSTEVRLYDRLFDRENPEDIDEGTSFLDGLNPDSLHVITNCMVEPAAREASSGETYQFERLGYFCVDPDSTPDALVFNRTTTLRESRKKAVPSTA